jgi:hypothetical protein
MCILEHLGGVNFNSNKHEVVGVIDVSVDVRRETSSLP